MDDLRALVADNLKRLRASRGYTQAQLAEAVGRSVDMVSRLERGDAAPSLDTIGQLAAALDAHPSELFGGSSVSEGSSPKAQRILRRLDGQSDDDVTWLLKLLDHIDRRPKA